MSESLYDGPYDEARLDRYLDDPEPEPVRRGDYEDPPEEYDSDSICGACQALLKPRTTVCQRDGGVCEVMLRRQARARR